MAIEVRPLVEMAEIDQVEDIQRQTWGMSEAEIMPARMMHALRHNGAALLGAFDGDQLVGFVLGVLGTVEELRERIDQVAAARLQMYSVIMGVLPEYQERGVGFQLKRAQREFALRIGVRLVTWTYDPLESRNAYFNIAKLGAVCQRYKRDFHGELGGINAGLPTDRFHIDWWVTTSRVEKRMSQAPRRPLGLDAFLSGGATIINPARQHDGKLPLPAETLVDSDASILLVEIPQDFQAIKRADMRLAQSWRAHSREIFERLFAAGYIVTDFVLDKGGGDRPGGSFYGLTHGDG
jgi:predicted GNAT superfamily acetyltransferase